MVNELIWDSRFFGRKIGELRIPDRDFAYARSALQKAKDEGFQYVICKIRSQDTSLIWFLESSGFYLSDIGITWRVKTAEFPFVGDKEGRPLRKSIVVAREEDIPMLKGMAKSLFLESRFYNDPFFSKEEADRLYEAWAENSVRGEAADVVFCLPEKGFVTCRKTGDRGEIVLIGIRKEFRGKGIGTALVEEAMEWFRVRGLVSVSVRTQMKNIEAMNFYLKLGFEIEGYDILFGKILGKEIRGQPLTLLFG